MLNLEAARVAALSGAKILCGDPSTRVRDVVLDNREITKGGTFVGFQGERLDGNRFAPAAVDAGAACVVVSCEPTSELLERCARAHVVLMRAANDDPIAWLLALAHEECRRHEWLCVGITGSVGKTTTKNLTLAALEARYRCHANAGNLNSVIGVPETVFLAPEKTQVLIAEMGMNHPGEIDALGGCVEPKVGAITNVGTSHIGLLGSREAIAKAKGELLPHLAASPSTPLFPFVKPSLWLSSTDDFTPYFEREAHRLGVETKTVGFSSRDTLWADDVCLDESGYAHFRLHDRSASFPVSLGLVGTQAVPDALIALGIASSLGVPLEEAACRLATVSAGAMRSDVRRASGGWTVIDDSYNASPSSVAAALTTLASLNASGRRICVLGEVGELGADSLRLHALMGSYVAAVAPDLALFVGSEAADAMSEAAVIMGYPSSKILRARDGEEALELLAARVSAGDLILVKASRSFGLERVSRGLGA